MKRLALALCALFLLATPAFAQTKAKTKAAPAVSAEAATFATGCYVGARAGHAAVDVGALDARSATFGAAVGCDYRISGSQLMIGVVGDVMASSASFGGGVDIDYSWFVGARGGLLLSESMLAYGLVGYTSADGSLPAGVSLKGLTWGGGLEVMVTKHISLQGEVRRIDLGNDTGGAGSADATELRAGINWRF